MSSLVQWVLRHCISATCYVLRFKPGVTGDSSIHVSTLFPHRRILSRAFSCNTSRRRAYSSFSGGVTSSSRPEVTSSNDLTHRVIVEAAGGYEYRTLRPEVGGSTLANGRLSAAAGLTVPEQRKDVILSSRTASSLMIRSDEDDVVRTPALPRRRRRSRPVPSTAP